MSAEQTPLPSVQRMAEFLRHWGANSQTLLRKTLTTSVYDHCKMT